MKYKIRRKTMPPNKVTKFTVPKKQKRESKNKFDAIKKCKIFSHIFWNKKNFKKLKNKFRSPHALFLYVLKNKKHHFY